MVPRMIARLSLTLALLAGAAPVVAQTVPQPAAIVLDGAPAVPQALAAATAPYQQARHANFIGWNTVDRSMLIKTRFGGTDQVHTVAAPDGDRRQLSFEAEPILAAALSPKGDTLVVQKDTGGDEFYQLYTLDAGRPRLITDGKSRNWFGAWSPDGKVIGYASSRRNGADMDLYVVDPRDPKTDRLVAQVAGGGWNIADFSADGSKALVLNRMSINDAVVYELDLASGKLKALTDLKTKASYVDPKYAHDGSVWLTSDKGSDFLRLGKLDAKTGAFTPVSKEPRWDVSDFAIAPDGSFVVYAINEAGVSRVRVLDVASGAVRTVAGLPNGVIPYAIGAAIDIAPWGQIGLSMASAKVPGDAFSIDSKTLAVTQWTHSETGGLDPTLNVEPKLVEVASFDGEKVSGFLYQPDPAKFPGKRPLIVDIHGGAGRPDASGLPGREQLPAQRAGHRTCSSRTCAARRATARGSSTSTTARSSARTRSRTSAPSSTRWRRTRPWTLRRFAVNGVSYGGYMCYATAVHYSARLKGANCYVAISNFVTFLQNTQSYRRDLRRVEYGDERDPKQRAQLEKISPLTSVDKITVPLLVATGGNDPRVPASEADQIIAAVRAKGGSAWHVLAKNEGHVFRKKENVDYYFWESVMFWRQMLLGDKAQ
jgi:dipeptidyl aminopeptidase/acylaminoacyl peptidase